MTRIGEPERRFPCALYRHFDQAGTLLYVGISDVPGARTKQHARGVAAWPYFAVTGTITWFRDRTAALDAEQAAILDEDPVFNVAGALNPARQEARAASYLYRHAHPSTAMSRPPEHPGDDRLVTLREAAAERVVDFDLRALRWAQRNRPVGFPDPVGRRGLARLYTVGELHEWERMNTLLSRATQIVG